MKKISFLFVLAFNLFFSQVGVNTVSPNATLDVEGKPTDPNKVDGVLVPRLSLAQLNAKNDSYVQEHKGSVVYVTDNILDISVVPDKVKYVTAPGYYVFNGEFWGSLEPQAGDVIFKGVKSTLFSLDNVEWNSVPLDQDTNIGGGDWDGYLYTIPVTGTYLTSARIKVDAPAQDIHINVGLDTDFDGPTGVWSGIPSGESTIDYFRSLYFKKGDKIRIIVYPTGGSLNCLSATLNMYLLSSYGSN